MCLLCREGNLLPEPPLERVRDYIHAITDTIPGCTVFLIGSYARGDYREGSDLDLIVAGPFTERFTDRIGRILDLIPPRFGMDVDVLAYTPEEIAAMRRRGNVFIEHADAEGIRL